MKRGEANFFGKKSAEIEGATLLETRLDTQGYFKHLCIQRSQEFRGREGLEVTWFPLDNGEGNGSGPVLSDALEIKN